MPNSRNAADAASQTSSINRSRSIQVVVSVFERLVQRGSTAAMSLMVALLAGPTELGMYASGLLIYTVYQAALESTFRQVGVSVWNLKSAAKRIDQMAVRLAVSGTTLLLVGLVLLASYSNDSALLFQMIPIALCPLFSAFYLKALTAMQRDGHAGWIEIGKKQFLASVLSLLVAVPIALWQPILGASIQLLAGEIVFSILIMRSRREYTDGDTYDRSLWGRDVIPTSLSNIFGWSQSQLERVVMLVLAGPLVLGIYTFSVAIARTVSDAVSVGAVNAVRGQISSTTGLTEKYRIFRVGASRALAIAFGCQLVISGVGVAVLPQIMDSSWDRSILLIPLFGISCVPSALAWLTSALAIERGRARSLMPVQIIGVILAIAVGVALSQSLILGAVCSVVRDLFAVFVRLWIMRDSVTRNFVFRIIFWIAASIASGSVLYILGVEIL